MLILTSNLNLNRLDFKVTQININVICVLAVV
jgi:hypothetical protein